MHSNHTSSLIGNISEHIANMTTTPAVDGSHHDSESVGHGDDEDLYWGTGLAIFGNILISICLNLQKFVHKRNLAREEQKHYTKEPLWWLGLCLMGMGEGCNFTAYGFAPASLVAPLGTTTVVANMFLAALFLKEKIRIANVFGCSLAILGAVLLVSFSTEPDTIDGSSQIIEALSEPSFIIYVCIELIIISILLVLLYYFKKNHVVVYLLISSVIASFTVISAKAVSGMIQLTVGGENQFDTPVLYGMLFVLIVTALIQIKYLNLAMKNYDATVVVPVNFVIFTASAILAGIIFYKEFLGMTAVDIAMFLLGCGLSFLSVYFVTFKTSDKEKGETKPQNILSDLIPAWMLTNFNVGQVQPTGGVEHLRSVESDSDQVPILRAVSFESDTAESAHEGDSVSLTSMDMLLDREKMGSVERTAYGTLSSMRK